MKREVDFSNYKVGDRVWDSWKEKWWTITKTEWGHNYPLCLSNGDSCTFAGKYVNDAPTSRYYPNAFEIPDSAFEKPLPELEVDAKVWVWSDYAKTWKRAHFVKWGDDGGMCVFMDGRTSHTMITALRFDLHQKWSLTDPTEAK